MKTVQTKKGTNLPLLNLKGKDYLQVAYRIQWFTEEESRFTVDTDFLVLTDEQTVCKVTVRTFDNDGKLIRQAQATKRETKRDFPDHTEKAETGAMGRALIELGYGTQFALSDLDEGSRLADSPLTSVSKTTAAYQKPVAVPATLPTPASASLLEAARQTIELAKSMSEPKIIAIPTTTELQPLKTSSFRKKPKEQPPVTKVEVSSVPENSEGW